MNLRTIFPYGSSAFFSSNHQIDDSLQPSESQPAGGHFKCGTCEKPFIDKQHKTRKFCSLQCAYKKRLDPRAWTDEQDDILRSVYKERGPAFDMPYLTERLGKTRAAIACRANELRLKLPKADKWKRPSIAKYTKEERSQIISEKMRTLHKTRPHPLLGKQVSQETRYKISKGNKGKRVPIEVIDKILKTRIANGSWPPKTPHGSWKAGWRDIGDKKIYARSRWEANYARYLEFQKTWGMIKNWDHEPKTFWFESIKRGSRSYLPDFSVLLNDGTTEYHEVKGWMDQRSQTKIKRFRKYYPQFSLVVKDAAWFRSQRLKLRACIPDWEDNK